MIFARVSMVYPRVEVGPNFRVDVEAHGRPVNGLRVEIRGYQSTDNRAVSDTDKNGLALFRKVRRGSYRLNAHYDVGIPDGADVEVKLGGPTDVTVHMKWPSIAPIMVRSLKGGVG
jgi:hypothetical protein